MTAGRKLLLVEYLIRPGNEPDPTKLRDLHMLVMLGGRERTPDDFERLLAAAGFRLADVIPTGSPYNIVEAVPAF